MSEASSQQGHSEMRWLTMDMLDMSFDDSSFDVVIDKATMDALMVDEGDVWNPNIGSFHDVLNLIHCFFKCTYMHRA
jgi:hypothetical protein